MFFSGSFQMTGRQRMSGLMEKFIIHCTVLFSSVHYNLLTRSTCWQASLHRTHLRKKKKGNNEKVDCKRTAIISNVVGKYDRLDKKKWDCFRFVARMFTSCFHCEWWVKSYRLWNSHTSHKLVRKQNNNSGGEHRTSVHTAYTMKHGWVRMCVSHSWHYIVNSRLTTDRTLQHSSVYYTYMMNTRASAVYVLAF